MLISNIKSDSSFENVQKFRYKETYGMVTSENLEHSLTDSLLW